LPGARQFGTSERVGSDLKMRWCSDRKERHIPALQPGLASDRDGSNVNP
jgi:hypothetical protein